MFNEETAAKIDHGLAVLALDQLTGKAPPPGQVSLALMASYCGVSEDTIRKQQRMALAKVYTALTSEHADLLPAHYLRRTTHQN